MISQVLVFIRRRLQSSSYLTLSELQRQFSAISKQQLSSALIEKSLKHEANFDLLCSIVLDLEGSMLIAHQRLSRIQQGFVLMITNNFEERKNFQKNNIKELKITTIISKDVDLESIKHQLMRITTISKQKKYFNNQLVSLKSRVLSQSSDNNKQVKNQKKSSQPQKKAPVLVKKQENQSVKPKQQSVKLNPLQRKTSKELNNPKPVKVIETPTKLEFMAKPKQAKKEEQKNVRSLKMNIQSDEQYYDKNKFNNMLQMMDIQEDEKAKETDSSGKKKDQIVFEHNIDKKISNFIVQDDKNDDEDDDDQDLFKKMDKVEVKAKTQPIQKKLPQVSSNTQQKIAPKAESKQKFKQKPQQAKKQATPPMGGGILGWLKQK